MLRDAQSDQSLYKLATQLGKLWGHPRLADEVSFRTSSRLWRTLGSFRASPNEITIATWLMDGPVVLRDEVFCHEAAHAAVSITFERAVRPHGPEWRDLVAKAGFVPRIRIPVAELPESQQGHLARPSAWEHRCPVCQATRFARIRMSRWRCSGCRALGRSGELVIERVPIPIPVDA